MSKYSGRCLCGAVAFEVDTLCGPFELCHCSRCRKSSGSAFAANITAETAGFRITRGRELIASVDLPILHAPPPYSRFFCSRCGAPTPEPEPVGERMEIPAGLFDTDLPVRPDKHIFVELRPGWSLIHDGLPQLTRDELIALRGAHSVLPTSNANSSAQESRRSADQDIGGVGSV